MILLFIAITKDNKKKEDKQITFKIPMDMYYDLIELSSKKGNKPIGEVIRFAIGDYISKGKLKGWI